MAKKNNNPYLQKIGSNIKAKRTKLGYSMNEFAAMAVLSKGQLYKIEAGSNASTILVLKRVADALKVKIGDLVD